jgi:O-antigen ligase
LTETENTEDKQPAPKRENGATGGHTACIVPAIQPQLESDLQHQWTAYLVGILLVVYPALTLVVPGVANTSLALLFLISLKILLENFFRQRQEKSEARTASRSSARIDRLPTRYAWAYSLAMMSLPIAIFASQWANQRWGWHYYDAASRFLFAIPVFFALRRIPLNKLLVIQYGLILGAFIAAICITYFARDWGSGRLGSGFLNPIHFGDISLTLGVLAALSINLAHKENRLMRFVKILSLLAGIYVSIKTGSRGGWIALPVFLALWIWFGKKTLSRKKIYLRVSMSMVIFLASYALIPEVSHRIDLIKDNLSAYAAGHDNTSIGIRFQLWHVAILLFESHPIFGVGMGGFKAAMPEMLNAKLLTQEAAVFGAQEVHSEILSRASQLGSFGLISILSIYLVPLFLFLRKTQSGSVALKNISRNGIVFVAGFFIYGLTVETFDLTMTAAFYSMSVAVFLAMAYNISNQPSDQ